MKKLFVGCLVLALLFCMVGCGGVDGMKFVRTKQDYNLTLTYIMEFSDDVVEYNLNYYDSNRDEYGNSSSKSGTYTCDGDKVHITWEDGDHDTFVYDEAAGSLSHTVEDWMVYYKE